MLTVADLCSYFFSYKYFFNVFFFSSFVVLQFLHHQLLEHKSKGSSRGWSMSAATGVLEMR